MKNFFIFMLLVVMMSCSHHHKTPKHHHHAYKKHCAYSVSKGDLKTIGSDDFKVTHGGKIYYFSSQAKKKLFLNEIETYIKNADAYWEDPPGKN